MKNRMFMGLILALAVLLLAGCGGGKYEYDASDYASISVTGLSTVGKADIKVDYSAISDASDLVSVQKDSETGNKIYLVLSTLNFDTDTDTEGLSNGDVVTVTATYDQELAAAANVTITNTTFDYVVEGLVEPIIVDPRDYIEISFTGENGKGELHGKELDQSMMTFFISPKTLRMQGRLSNGDIMTLSVSTRWDSSEPYLLTEDEFDVVVFGLEE